MSATPPNFSTYPRDIGFIQKLRTLSDACNSLVVIFVIHFVLGFGFLVLGNAGRSVDPAQHSRDYYLGMLIGKFAVISGGPVILMILPAFFQFKKIGNSLDWKPWAGYLAAFLMLIGSCFCLSGLTYIVMLYLAGQAFTRAGAPSGFIVLQQSKTRAFIDSLVVQQAPPPVKMQL